MDSDFKKRLSGFEAVWKRVSGENAPRKIPPPAAVMPRKGKKPKRRFE